MERQIISVKKVKGVQYYLEDLSTIILSVLPILSPYTFLGPISINIFLVLLFSFLLFICNLKINWGMVRFTWFLWIVHSFMSLISMLGTDPDPSHLYSLLVGTAMVVGIGYLWSNSDYTKFLKYSNAIGIFCCIYLFIQAICLSLDITPPSGRILGLHLLDYASFVQNTWGFRLNSIFQEPSYFAIYTLPLLSYNLNKKAWLTSLVYIFALILSSSSLGIIGVVITVLYIFLFKKKNKKYIFASLTILLVIHFSFMSISEFYSTSFYRSIDKLQNIERDSQIRLQGQLYLYDYLEIGNQMYGVGINQMQNHFMRSGHIVYNYSNSIVVTLINFGLLGLSAYFVFIISIGILSVRLDISEYFIIFLAVALTDYFIYNSFFFYLLAFIFIKLNQSMRCKL